MKQIFEMPTSWDKDAEGVVLRLDRYLSAQLPFSILVRPAATHPQLTFYNRQRFQPNQDDNMLQLRATVPLDCSRVELELVDPEAEGLFQRVSELLGGYLAAAG